MIVSERATEEDRPGRWHCRLAHPAGIIHFEDVQADNAAEAISTVSTLFPGEYVEWAVWEPSRYGVFASAFGPA